MSASSIPILCYHRIADVNVADRLRPHTVTPAAFQRQMSLLARLGYRTVSLSHVPVHNKVLRRCVVLTFDDGYADIHEVVLPILRQYKFVATVFLVTEWLDDKTADPPAPATVLSLAQVRRLTSHGITIGSHSRRHRRLTELAPSELQDEVVGAKEQLEAILAQPVKTFAYPYGLSNPAVRRVVQSAGYTLAVAVNNGTNDPFNLRRAVVKRSDNPMRFMAMLLSWPVQSARIALLPREDHSHD